jgi:metal-responsive CopG/Arc/MetJ family transcriptional regulator
MCNAMRKKIIQVPMPGDLLDTLDRYSREAGTSRAALIREACASYITRSEETEADRQYVESYRKFPESHSPAEEEARMRMVAEVWGEEDWSDWDPPSD